MGIQDEEKHLQKQHPVPFCTTICWQTTARHSDSAQPPKSCHHYEVARFDTIMPVQKPKPVLTDHICQPAIQPRSLHRSNEWMDKPLLIKK